MISGSLYRFYLTPEAKAGIFVRVGKPLTTGCPQGIF
jgi:hypothetical protein